MFNMNSGYVGWSRSKRAAAAYEDGEMPASKWTKKAMLAAIAEVLDKNGIELSEEQMKNLEKMPKDVMFLYFHYSSTHHTSKFCNNTNFYAVDEESVVFDAQHTKFEVGYCVYGRHCGKWFERNFDTKREAVAWMKRNKIRHEPTLMGLVKQ